MNEKEEFLPTKDEVVRLLDFAKNDRFNSFKTIDELVGMKLIDNRFFIKIKNEPEWNYKGLMKFFCNHSIDLQSTIEDALDKLNEEI